MKIDSKVVMSLSDFFSCIAGIKCSSKYDEEHPPVLWYRGVSDMGHSLVPSIFRTETRVWKNDSSEYSQMHYAEDIRTQHYIAKNYHFFQNEPSSRVEWLEVMQHHGVKTRVLDWSESSVHSLLFAVESFLGSRASETNTVNSDVPCVWVLEPAALNKSIFQFIKEKADSRDFNELDELFQEFNYNDEEIHRVMECICHFSEFDTFAETGETSHIDYIFDLSVISDELQRDRWRMKNLLLTGNVINPYYYVLSRIYSDGHILKDRKLPPLAVVHPYHSERIKSQHGVFTVFPFYEEHEDDNDCRKVGLNPDAMEINKLAGSVLHKIIIGSPQKMAYELMKNGMNDSWLYPEMPVVSNEIENHTIYC